jgi:plastocyanin domain-containing protein
MTVDQIIVTVGGLLAAGFIAWFFWMKKEVGVRIGVTTGGYQEVMILVKGGYTPDVIVVEHGKPVRLNFRREETAGCSDTVIFPDFAKSSKLPTGQTVSIELLPKKPGEYEFRCGMGMLKGKLIAE